MNAHVPLLHIADNCGARFGDAAEASGSPGITRQLRPDSTFLTLDLTDRAHVSPYLTSHTPPVVEVSLHDTWNRVTTPIQ